MTVCKGYSPYLAHYLTPHQVISFKENEVELNDISKTSFSRKTFILDTSYFRTADLPENYRKLPKKAVRYLLNKGNVFTRFMERLKVSVLWAPSEAVAISAGVDRLTDICDQAIMLLKSAEDNSNKGHNPKVHTISLNPSDEKDPLAATVFYLDLLKTQIRNGEGDAAKTTFENCARLGKSTPAAWLIRSIEAAFLQKEGNLVEASKHYYELGMSAEKPDLAIHSFEEALLCDPKNTDIYTQLAALYQGEKKVLLFLLAFLHIYPEDQAKGSMFYELACKLAPQHPLVYVSHLSRLSKGQIQKRVVDYRHLAEIFENQKNTQEALRYLKKAARSHEDQDFRRYINALLAQKESQKAAEVYREWSLHAPAKAEELIQEGLKLTEELPLLLDRLCTLYHEAKNPALKEIAHKLGEIFVKENKVHEAIRVYQLAFDTFEDFHTGCKLADLFFKNGQIRESFRVYSHLNQEAEFNGQHDNVTVCLAKMEEFRPLHKELGEGQKLFLLATVMMNRRLKQVEDLTTIKTPSREIKSNFSNINWKAVPRVQTLPNTLNLTGLKNGGLVVTNKDGIVRLYDPEGKEKIILSSGGQFSCITEFAGETLVITSGNEIKLWNLPRNDTIVLTCSSFLSNTDKGEILKCIELRGGGFATSSQGDIINLWNKNSNSYSQPTYPLCGFTSDMIEFDDGTLGLPSVDCTIKRYTREGKSMGDFSSHEKNVRIFIKLKGGALVSLLENNLIQVWDQKGTCLKTFLKEGAQILTLIEWGGTLVGGCLDNTIKRWDLEGNCIGILQGHTAGVSTLMELSDGTLLSGSFDDTIKLWNPEGSCLNTLKGYTSGRPIIELRAGVLAAGFAPGKTPEEYLFNMWSFPVNEKGFVSKAALQKFLQEPKY